MGGRGSEPLCTGPPGVYGLLSSTPPTREPPRPNQAPGSGRLPEASAIAPGPFHRPETGVIVNATLQTGRPASGRCQKPRTAGLQVTRGPPTSEAARSQEPPISHDTLKTLCPKGLGTVGRDRQLGPLNPQKRPEGKEIPSSSPGAPQPACQLCPPHRESSPCPLLSAAFSWLSLHHGLGELRFPVCTPP